VTDGRSPSAVARELGVRPDMLRSWRRQLGAKRTTSESASGALVSQDEELRRLRRELERVTQERDFL
jgi:transposase